MGKMVVGPTGFFMTGPHGAWAPWTPTTCCTPPCTACGKCRHTSWKCATYFQGLWLASEDSEDDPASGPLGICEKWLLVERAVCILDIPGNLCPFLMVSLGLFVFLKPFWSKWFLIEMRLSLSCKLAEVYSVNENNIELMYWALREVPGITNRPKLNLTFFYLVLPPSSWKFHLFPPQPPNF